MAVTLGTNVASLGAQRKLGDTTGRLSTVFERLSSGQRINKASDDAAGLAIADSLRTDARLYSTAQRNINDGISLINIVTGTISNQKSILIRLSELAEQSANGVYSDDQREALNAEYQALVREFGRLGEAAEFNGQEVLLAGRGDNAEQILLQAGIDGSEDSILSILGADTGSYNGTVISVGDIEGGPGGLGDGDGDKDAFDLTAYTQFTSGQYTFQELADFIDDRMVRESVIDSNGEVRELVGMVSLGALFGSENEFSFDFFSINRDTALYDRAGGLSSVEESTAEAQPLDFTLSFENGATAEITMDFRGLEIIEDNTKEAVTQTAINFTGVETVSRARAALEMVGNRLDELSSIEGQFGALQSRLETAKNVVAASQQGSLSAESRIRDADIAQESSELTRLNILQQAAAAVLGQANQQPALALSLLT